MKLRMSQKLSLVVLIFNSNVLLVHEEPEFKTLEDYFEHEFGEAERARAEEEKKKVEEAAKVSSDEAAKAAKAAKEAEAKKEVPKVKPEPVKKQ